MFSDEAITASATLGIALSLLPPETDTIYISAFSFKVFKILFIALLEFSLPLWISAPECPPANPCNFILYANPFSIFVLFRGNKTSIFSPPADPTGSIPSSSESRLISISPFNTPGFRAIAPPKSISSEVVIKNSKGPCWSLSFSAIASIIATAIPLSAPNVVLLALK